MGTFSGFTIVSCGTLSPELNHLSESGFLDADKVLYTIPGLHENKNLLQHHLTRQLARAQQFSSKVIVVYGEKCYINMATEPPQLVDDLITAQGGCMSRVRASNCIDMLCSYEERSQIAGNEKVYWLTAGWLKYWKHIFNGWDSGKANETFPQNDKAILLDAVGIYDDYIVNSPQNLLEFSDWMKLPIEPHPVSLDRLQGLLLEQVHNLEKEDVHVGEGSG
jgi:hypothetical protein